MKIILAIIAAVWLAVMVMFCITWAGLIRMIRHAEENLGAATSDKIVELDFPKDPEAEKPAA